MDDEEVGRCWTCGAGPCMGKSKWPELVGKKGSEAKKIIESENPIVEVHYINCHDKRIMNCCCDRVFLFVDVTHSGGDFGEGTVCYLPRVG